MPTNKKQQKMTRYRERALDPNEAPMRRLRAAKSLVELAGYSQRTCPVARRVANELLNPEMPQDIRDVAIRLLENVAAGEARRLSAVRQEPVAPAESVDDEVERIVNGEAAPLPMGIKMELPVAKPVVPKVEPHSCGITNIEHAYPFIAGLENFDFDDPRGIEGVKGEPWKNHHALLLESIGQRVEAHDLYADIGARIGEDHLTRKTLTPEQLKAAVVAFADRNVDPSKSGFQLRLVDWQIAPIPAATKEGTVKAPAPASKSEALFHLPIPARAADSVPVTDTTCSICRNASAAFPAPAHECRLFQVSTMIGTRKFPAGTSEIRALGTLPAIMPGQDIPPSRATCRICSAVMPSQAPPHHDCSQFQF